MCLDGCKATCNLVPKEGLKSSESGESRVDGDTMLSFLSGTSKDEPPDSSRSALASRFRTMLDFSGGRGVGCTNL